MPAKKLETPKGLEIDLTKMELSFDFVGCKKHLVSIMDSNDKKLYLVCDEKVENGSLGGKIVIKLISLLHIGPYLAGKFTINMKALAVTADEVTSDVATIEFALTAEQAALANTRLLIKKVGQIEKTIEQLEQQFGTKAKLFPELEKKMGELNTLLDAGKVDLKKVEALKAETEATLTKIGTVKNERSTALKQLQTALEEVKKLKELASVNPANKESAEEVEIITGWLAVTFGAMLLFVLVLVALVITGLLLNTHLLAPNGVQPTKVVVVTNTMTQVSTPVPTPAQVIVVTNTVIVQAQTQQLQQTSASTAGSEQMVNLPLPQVGSKGQWTGCVKPNQTLTFMYPTGCQVICYFDPLKITGEMIRDGSGNCIGGRLELLQASDEQPIQITITRN